MTSLAGVTVLIVRPREQAAPLAARLEARGARVLIQPPFAFGPPPDPVAVRAALDRVASFDWLVFASQTGVRFFLEAATTQGVALGVLAGRKFAAIGPATANALAAAGLAPAVIAERSDSEGLAEALRDVARGTRVLLIRADRGREVLPRELSAVASVEETAFYSQIDATALEPEVKAAIGAGEVRVVLLTSAAGARNLLRLMEPALPEGTPRPALVALSSVTAAAIGKAGWPVARIAAEATAEALADAVVELVEQGPEDAGAGR